jgi:DnaJ-domain-containing protein 1
MSLSELTVSFLCLVAGYVGVTWWLNRKTPEMRESSARPEGADRAPPPQTPQSGIAWNVVLDVDAAATRSAITAAYRQKIGQYHPDKVSQMGPEIRALAEKKSKEINAAYEAGLASLSRRNSDVHQ